MDRTINKKTVEDTLRQVRHPEINDNIVNLGMFHGAEIKGEEVTIHLALPLDEIPKEIRHKIAEEAVAACKKAHPGVECLIHFEKMTQEEHDRFCEMASEEWVG